MLLVIEVILLPTCVAMAPPYSPALLINWLPLISWIVPYESIAPPYDTPFSATLLVKIESVNDVIMELALYNESAPPDSAVL